MRITTNLVISLILTGLAAWAADAKAGLAVYTRACKSCHGADGVAPGAIAKMMKAEIKDLKTSVASHSDSDLKKVIVEGKGKMVATKGVNAADVDNVIAYLHTLK